MSRAGLMLSCKGMVGMNPKELGPINIQKQSFESGGKKHFFPLRRSEIVEIRFHFENPGRGCQKAKREEKTSVTRGKIGGGQMLRLYGPFRSERGRLTLTYL